MSRRNASLSLGDGKNNVFVILISCTFHNTNWEVLKLLVLLLTFDTIKGAIVITFNHDSAPYVNKALQKTADCISAMYIKGTQFSIGQVLGKSLDNSANKQQLDYPAVDVVD